MQWIFWGSLWDKGEYYSMTRNRYNYISVQGVREEGPCRPDIN